MWDKKLGPAQLVQKQCATVELELQVKSFETPSNKYLDFTNDLIQVKTCKLI